MSADEPRPAPQIVIQQRSSAFGRYGKWLLAALVASIVFSIGLYSNYSSYFSPGDGPQEKYHSLAQFAPEKIAIIEISGAILEGEDSFAMQQIRRVREDKSIVGIVLRINSPGGTVTGSDYIYHHLCDLVKERQNLPVVVSMGSVCASGGYYIAMAVGNRADTIFAEPTTWTGSIGVIIPHFDFSNGMNLLGISEDSISSGPLKKMGSPTRRMSSEERKILQSLVDESFRGFKEIVATGRPKFKNDEKALDAVATGQIFTAQQAVEKGLVDKIGFIEAAIDCAATLAKKDRNSVRCVKYERPPTFVGELLGTEAQAAAQHNRNDLAALIELSSPRAYYLWSWLPSALPSLQ
ncbi:MAG: signal peptide peptidase SppA [Pirellulales bacterium]|nr:signal peptide peptidase SppA [Pirellulales bacterium]